MTTSVELPGELGSQEHPQTPGHNKPVHLSSGNGNGSSTALPPSPPAPPVPPRPRTLNDSAKLYSIQQWGSGYFSINSEGHVAVHPTQSPDVSVDLKKLVDELRERL